MWYSIHSNTFTANNDQLQENEKAGAPFFQKQLKNQTTKTTLSKSNQTLPQFVLN